MNWRLGHSTTLLVGELPRPNHELEGYHLWDGVLVGGSFAEHMPYVTPVFVQDLP